MEFISYARYLLKFTVSMGSKIPKKYTFYGVIHCYKLAQEVLDKLIKGNALDLKTYREKRAECFDDALGSLACLSNHLELVKSYIELDDKYWVKWATLIGITERLVKGVKNKDKERLGV